MKEFDMKELDMKETMDINGGAKYNCSCGYSTDWYIVLGAHISALGPENGHAWV
ncbi:hypothetical protein KQI45_04765 [Clostridium sporogenes]|uniref:hypothetical protein n=1 Tax=Clostridium sporogenes TaxID=1509 RepID=UPI0013D08765|nr:hypothetical protein [Clostridium sporogenes]MBU5299388.1 hypothetical protein [Clostridium sporogenes]